MAKRELETQAAAGARGKAGPERAPGKRGGAGRAILVLLCLLLIGASAALVYADQLRDFRHGVYRCEDGRLLEAPAEPDEDKVEKTAAGLKKVAEAFPDTTQYLMVVPGAACVQAGYLPSGAAVRDQAADLARIRQRLAGGASWIDLVDLFRAHAGEKLYYATDTFLTGWGSRYAAKAALEALGADAPAGKEKCYLLSDSFLGRLAADRTLLQRFFQNKGERLEIYVPEQEAKYYREDVSTGRSYGSLYDASALTGASPYDIFFGGERPLTEIHSTAANGRTLLVVGDRTADSVVPLFVSSYENIILLHPAKSAQTVAGLIGKYQPEQVLYLYGANTFMRDRALLRALPK